MTENRKTRKEDKPWHKVDKANAVEFRRRTGSVSYRLRSHLVRLAKVQEDAEGALASHLSGGATLVKSGDRRGLVTAAHNVVCEFPRRMASFIGQSMEILVGTFRSNQMAVVTVDLSGAVIEGGLYERGDERKTGPDIAWIPLDDDAANRIEKYGRVFFNLHENRFSRIIGKDKVAIGDGGGMYVGFLVTGYSGVREEIIWHEHGPGILEIAQDVYPYEDRWCAEGWDYEIRVIEDGGEVSDENFVLDLNLPDTVRSKVPTRVESLGGLSGGGLWIFGEDKDMRQYVDLVGVVWYQSGNQKHDNSLRIVNHGRASIDRIIGGKKMES